MRKDWLEGAGGGWKDITDLLDVITRDPTKRGRNKIDQVVHGLIAARLCVGTVHEDGSSVRVIREDNSKNEKV